MDEPSVLTPEQARARFGELRHSTMRVYQQFQDPTGGVWLPDMERTPGGGGLVLRRYRLHPPVKSGKTHWGRRKKPLW